MTLMSPKGGGNQPDRVMAPRLTSLNGLRIGLLSNLKLNADLILRETADCFVRDHQCEVVDLIGKPHASKPAPAESLATLAEQADLLITANGD
jgi:hypothetical protein